MAPVKLDEATPFAIAATGWREESKTIEDIKSQLILSYSNFKASPRYYASIESSDFGQSPRQGEGSF